MPCLTTSERIELALATAVEGRPDPVALDHAHSCERCGRAVAEYVAVLRSVASIAPTPEGVAGRVSCLNEEEAAAFAEGTTLPEKRPDVEAHVAQCRSCFEQVVELTRLVRELDVERPTLLGFVLGIARDGLSLLKRPLEGFQEMPFEPVPLLGEPASPEPGKNVVAWAQSVGATTLEFTVSKATDNFVDLKVRALAQGAPVNGGRFTLRAENAIVQSEDLSTGGEVILHHLEPISYELDIAIPQQEHVRCGLTLYALEEPDET